jgi:hypothetical protein
MNTFFKHLSFLLIFAAVSTLHLPLHAQETIPGVESIRASRLLETVTFFSSPELQGRKPGSEGYYRAAAYAADYMAQLGLEPAGDDGFFQNVDVEYAHITGNPEFILLQGEETVKSFELGSDFVCRGITGFADIAAEVVFCGYGISEEAYDDYAGTDVTGKIVMVFKQNPAWEIKGFDAREQHNRYRANVAASRGALGMILVSTPLSKNPQKPIGSIMDGSGTYQPNFPQIHADISVADMLLHGSGKPSLKELQHTIDIQKKPQSLALGIRVRIHIEGEYHPAQKSMNVAGLLPGSDPELMNEYLVIGAHLDHVGSQGHHLYFPGANDNASGSAAVLAIAEAFAKNDILPERSVYFVLYTSEEQGMLGSKHFVEHAPVPAEQIVAALNLDCIAFGDSIQIGAGKANPALWNIAWQLDSLTSKRMSRASWQGGGADLEAFYQAGIPGLYFVTRDSYAHLHLPSDLPETLNQGLFEQIVKLAYGVAHKVASGAYIREQLIR